MTSPSAADDADRSPATLFVKCWLEAEQERASDRAIALQPGEDFRVAGVRIAEQGNPQIAYDGLEALIDRARSRSQRLGNLLATMAAIDHVFLRIHPRAAIVPPGRVARPPIPYWLRDLRDRRAIEGAYLESSSRLLVPRGPLLRTARNAEASCADSLADRFAALCLAPAQIDFDGQAVPIRVLNFGSDVIDGVSPVPLPGRERIAFVPLAEDDTDLEVSRIDHGGRPFIRFAPTAALDVVQRMIDAVGITGQVEMAIAPELVTTPDGIETLSHQLRTLAAAPNITLAGTANTTEQRSNQPFNEAVILNSTGSVLFRQRKLWPASFSADDACKIGLVSDTHTERLPENNASGAELFVADFDGFGRVIVLICQDFTHEFAEHIINFYQPDWVLVPILDHGFAGHRWAHKRAFALSQNAQSRFVAVTSSSLAHLLSKPLPAAIGMAVGPATSEEASDTDRASILLTADPARSPAVAMTQWRGPGWSQVTVELYK